MGHQQSQIPNQRHPSVVPAPPPPRASCPDLGVPSLEQQTRDAAAAPTAAAGPPPAAPSLSDEDDEEAGYEIVEGGEIPAAAAGQLSPVAGSSSGAGAGPAGPLTRAGGYPPPPVSASQRGRGLEHPGLPMPAATSADVRRAEKRVERYRRRGTKELQAACARAERKLAREPAGRGGARSGRGVRRFGRWSRAAAVGLSCPSTAQTLAPLQPHPTLPHPPRQP
jgi:hypothetical protein